MPAHSTEETTLLTSKPEHHDGEWPRNSSGWVDATQFNEEAVAAAIARAGKSSQPACIELNMRNMVGKHVQKEVTEVNRRRGCVLAMQKNKNVAYFFTNETGIPGYLERKAITSGIQTEPSGWLSWICTTSLYLDDDNTIADQQRAELRRRWSSRGHSLSLFAHLLVLMFFFSGASAITLRHLDAIAVPQEQACGLW